MTIPDALAPPRRPRKQITPPKPQRSTPSPPLTAVPSWIDHLIQLAQASSPTPHPNLPPSLTPLSIAEQAAATVGPARVRTALTLFRTHDAVDLSALIQHSPPELSLIALIKGPDAAPDPYADPADKAALVVAAHALCSHKSFSERFLAENGLQALCNLVRPPALANASPIADRPSPPITPSSDASSTLSATLEKPIPHAIWNAAIRTIAKLMVCSVTACALSIQTGALRLLALAARPAQPMDIRLRAAAGLAAIAAWSGPRRAVEIVQTEDVVLSMSALLTETDERIPNDLRTATMDGLVVMSYRRHARRILQKYGCEEKIKAAALHASVSGDYSAAARGTVAAGQLTGRSIDEYGFLVEDEPQNPGSSFGRSSPREQSPSRDDASQSSDHQHASGLRQIHLQLLEEPYTSVEDLTVLEEIVHEEAGVLSSSPRDRNFMRHAARSFGVSADEIEFISVAEDDAPAAQTPDGAVTPVTNSTARPISVTQGLTSLFGKIAMQSVEGGDEVSGSSSTVKLNPTRNGVRTAAGSSVSLVVSKDTETGQSARASSNMTPAMADPDFDRNFEENDDVAKSTVASSAGASSNLLPPLLMFSSAAKKAAEKDKKNSLLQKTNSQLWRETEHERRWKHVLNKRPDMLKRERGAASRVVAYRELALVPVPSAMRRTLWPILLDTGSIREASPGLYRELCKEGEEKSLPDDIEHTIEADVTRTMPLHSLFWAGGAQVGVQSLRSILRAYAFYVPSVGYCQGMSSIAAVLIMNAKDEEEAFLMMVQFMNRFEYKKVFAPGFPLMLQWISELKPLVAHYMPQLSERLERENVFLELYADKWLITALSHNFPHRHLLRVWDLMFLGGSPRIILKACLAVLKRCEGQLMEMEFETMMPFLQREFAKPESGVLDVKNPEPFITEMRAFRFLSDIRKSEGRIAGTAHAGTGASSQASKSTRNTPAPAHADARRKRSCLPCFKRSEIVD